MAPKAAPRPQYLKGHVGVQGRGIIGFNAHEGPWIGDDMELDDSEIAAEIGYEQYPYFELLVDAIIAAYPTDDAKQTNDVRRLTVLAALFGKKKNRGRPRTSDDEILMDTASCYFRNFVSNGGKPRSIRSAVEEALQSRLDRIAKQRNISPDSLQRQLERKFKKDKDWYLVRATNSQSWERMHKLVSVRKILRSLESLGIKSRTPSA